jgi:hypothetical protein
MLKLAEIMSVTVDWFFDGKVLASASGGFVEVFFNPSPLARSRVKISGS